MASLNTLPEELLTHIATCCDALSALRLSCTCRKARSAAYDGLVFKAILKDSQELFWKRESLETGSIQQVAGKNVQSWARYALADQKATELAQKECPLETPSNFLSWLPALFTVKHPFMYDPCWARFLRDGENQPLEQVFCQVMAVLASHEDMPQLRKSVKMQEGRVSLAGSGSKAYLWTLCEIALSLRTSLRTRQAVWPYNNAANVPQIIPPKATQIAMNQSLALPFAKHQKFENWYSEHNEQLKLTPEFFTQGKWCGYYTHLGHQSQQVDPPMVNINFRVVPASCSRPDQLSLRADDCQDGIGPFEIAGVLRHLPAFGNGKRIGETAFSATKSYGNGHDGWRWDLRLTPFGMVGFWGPYLNRGYGQMHPSADKLGLVWLWKEEWTATT